VEGSNVYEHTGTENGDRLIVDKRPNRSDKVEGENKKRKITMKRKVLRRFIVPRGVRKHGLNFILEGIIFVLMEEKL